METQSNMTTLPHSHKAVASLLDLAGSLNHAEGTAITPRMRFGGVIAAMITPCREAGIVDPLATRRLADILIEHGCDGLFVAGSTGELPLLDEGDRRTVIAAACEGASEKATVYAGVSGTGLKQTIQYARNAAADGAHVAVVMAPFFLKLRQVELLYYLQSVADGSPIPVALYHHPRAATPMNVDTVASAAEHANIVAIKDTSHDVDRINALVAATANLQISILQGNESLILDSLNLGATGMVTALANIAPEWHAELYRAHQLGDAQEATALQSQIAKLRDLFGIEQVSKSISAFTYALRLALVQRGWLENLAGMVEGFIPSETLTRSILHHLGTAGMVPFRSEDVRIDAKHSLNAEKREVA
jgi:4-hydroxy-tetrahydrodipicolinate synthase